MLFLGFSLTHFFFLSQFKAGSGSRCSKKRISTAQMMQIRPDWHYWVGEIIFLHLSVGGGGRRGGRTNTPGCHYTYSYAGDLMISYHGWGRSGRTRYPPPPPIINRDSDTRWAQKYTKLFLVISRR